MNKSKANKILSIALNVLVYFFLAVCILSVIVTVFFPKSDDGATTVFGYQLRLVTSGSMEKSAATDVSDYKIKSIPKDSVIVIKTVPDDADKADDWYENEVQIGDVLTVKYLYERQVVITHRVVDKYPNTDGDGYVVVLEGDNKNGDVKLLKQTIYTADEDSLNYIIGKVEAKSYLFGVFIGAMKQPLSLLLLIILPCLIIIVVEIFKILNIVSAEKKERAIAENAKKDEEILNLKKQIDELKQKSELVKESNQPLTPADEEVVDADASYSVDEFCGEESSTLSEADSECSTSVESAAEETESGLEEN